MLSAGWRIQHLKQSQITIRIIAVLNPPAGGQHDFNNLQVTLCFFPILSFRVKLKKFCVIDFYRQMTASIQLAKTFQSLIISTLLVS